ncbi:Homeobox protein HD-3 [Dictyocoela muelleri]|nr:Homeobox protein HD-3 [Dictyocoela muelleri]
MEKNKQDSVEKEIKQKKNKIDKNKIKATIDIYNIQNKKQLEFKINKTSKPTQLNIIQEGIIKPAFKTNNNKINNTINNKIYNNINNNINNNMNSKKIINNEIVNNDNTIINSSCCAKTNFSIKKQKNIEEKRNRTIMNPARSAILKKYFRINMFPSTEVREELARILDIKPRSVQIWFQNQRQKVRMCKFTNYVYPLSNIMDLYEFRNNNNPGFNNYEKNKLDVLNFKKIENLNDHYASSDETFTLLPSLNNCLGYLNVTNYITSNESYYNNTFKDSDTYSYNNTYEDPDNKTYKDSDKNTSNDFNFKNVDDFKGLKLLAEAAYIVLNKEIQNKNKKV